MKILNWLVCKPWLFTAKIYFLSVIFLSFHYFMGPERLILSIFLLFILEWAGKLYTPKESV